METTTENQESKKVEADHKPKNWKKYFIEFLMIFLAVTMGFFAESYREHLIDRSEEREYLAQLIEDLKEDMAECGVNNSHSVIAINTRIGNYCGSLIDILSKSNPSRKEVITAYYMYQWIITDWFTAYFKDATWSQLKSNGGFRDIDNPDVVREINDYYKWANVINDFREGIRERHSAINYNEGRKVFDLRMERRMLDSISNKFYTKLFAPADSITQFASDDVSIQFADRDAETRLGLCNDLRSYKSLLILYNEMIEAQGIKAEKLVQLISKEYQLNDH